MATTTTPAPAPLRNQITIGGKLFIETGANPSVSGLAATVGSLAVWNDAGAGSLYLKTAATDTDWSIIQAGAIDLSPYLKHDGTVAISGVLAPDTNIAYDLGTTALRFNHLFAVSLRDASSQDVITATRTLVSDNGTSVLSWANPWLDAQGVKLSSLANGASGTQDAATVAQMQMADFLKLSLSGGTMSGALSMGENQINLLANGTLATDAVNKGQMSLADSLNLPLSGGTMSGIIAMGNNKITGIFAGSNTQDAVNYGQLAALSAGAVWLDPIKDVNLIDDTLVTPPGSPAIGDTFIAAATAFGWIAGYAYSWNGSTWTDLLARAVIAGDRFGVSMESTTSASGGLAGLDNDLVEILSPTPGAITYQTPLTLLANHAVYCNNPLSYHSGHQYNYNGSYWVEFGGLDAISAGIGLGLAGNSLYVKMGAGIVQLPSDEIGVDFKSDGAIWLVDPSTGLPSTATDAQLSTKLDSIGYATLSKSTDGIRIAALGIKNAEVATDAAIAYSKLNLATSIMNGDINASAAIAYSKLNLAASIMDSDINALAAIAYSKLNLASSIVDADISATAAIAFSKFAALTSGNILVGSAGNVATSVAMSGEATIIDTGAVTLSNAAVIAKTLTGYTAGAGTVTNADSILTAIQKIDANANAAASLTGGDMIVFAANDISVDLSSTGGLSSTSPGAASGQLQIKLDDGTLSTSALGLKVNSISDAQISATAAIAFNKMAVLTASKALVSDGSGVVSASAVTATELGYVGGVTSALQTQLDAKWQFVPDASSLNVAASAMFFGTYSGDYDINFMRDNVKYLALEKTAGMSNVSLYSNKLSFLGISATIVHATQGLNFELDAGGSISATGSFGITGTTSIGITSGSSDLTLNSGLGNLKATTKMKETQFKELTNSIHEWESTISPLVLNAATSQTATYALLGVGLTKKVKLEIFYRDAGNAITCVWEKMVHINEAEALVLTQDSFTSQGVGGEAISCTVSCSAGNLLVDLATLPVGSSKVFRVKFTEVACLN